MRLTAIVTAYIATGHPCADGHMPVAGVTIAAPRNIPLGSHVVVNGHEYLVEDRTAKRFDGRFDIFMARKTDALNWGRRKLSVTILTLRQ